MYYRFRSIEKLLGFSELEKEEIYFASPSNLNDPMEGIRDITWYGDEIVWNNLFRHYLLCLYNAISIIDINPTKIYSVPVFFEEKIIIDETEIIQSFLTHGVVRTTIEYLLSLQEPIRRNEFFAFLNILHPIALGIITKKSQKEWLYQRGESPDHQKFIDAISEQKALQLSKENKEKLFEQILNFFSPINIIAGNLNANSEDSDILFFVNYGFVNNYLNKIEMFTIPRWHTVCFMTEYDNSSLWGYYGDNHKGVCLIYDLGKEKKLKVEGKTNNVYLSELIEFKEVNYKKKIINFDFFKSLFKIIQLNEKYRKQWFYNNEENSSLLYKVYTEDLEIWKKEYLELCSKLTLQKDEVWKFENEHRLVVFDYWNEYDERGFALKYDFSALKGIIFGIKTTDQNKFKILKILRDKGLNEENFTFYQAYYNNENGKIEKYKIPLFEFYKLYNEKLIDSEV